MKKHVHKNVIICLLIGLVLFGASAMWREFFHHPVRPADVVSTEEPTESVEETANSNKSSKLMLDLNKIQYAKDERTGLCFAFYKMQTIAFHAPSGIGMASVDCVKAGLD